MRHCSIRSPNSHKCTIEALATAREQRISISSTRSGIYMFDQHMDVTAYLFI